MILNRRALLASLGLALSAGAAEAASATRTIHKKKVAAVHAVKATAKPVHRKPRAAPLS